jgi:hypothetical protein
MNNKAYIINRAGDERQHLGKVTVTVVENGIPTRELQLEPSLKVRNHSPTGFEFGYGGSGPSQLALAILLDHLGQPPSPVVYQAFKFFAIAPMQHPGGVIKGEDIDKWLLQFEASEGSLPDES